VLLLAAALKSRHLGDFDFRERDLLSSRLFWEGVIWLELGVGLWLMSNVYARPATIFAIGCFAVYFQFSLYFAAVHQSTCPCFGRVDVSSRTMAVIDFFALFTLLNCLPAWSESATWRTHPRRIAVLAALLIVLGSSSFAAINHYRPDAVDHTLRNDEVLAARVVLDNDAPGTEWVLERLSYATGGMPFELDPELGDGKANLGSVHLSGVFAWTAMEWLAGEQSQPADWVRADGGYLLRRVPAWREITPATLLLVDLLAVVLAVWVSLGDAARYGERGAAVARAMRAGSHRGRG
jgi:hypothetical protein